MSDARQALEAARQVDAASHAPETLQDAQSLLSKAAEKLGEGAFEQAQRDALAAKEEATRARAMAAAISAATAAVQEAESLEAVSAREDAASARGLLQQAEAAALRNDDQAAVHLALAARQRAERDINQAWLHRTRILLDEMQTLQPLSSAQQAEIRAIEEAYRREEGKAAHASAQRLVGELREMQRLSPPVIPLPPPVVIAPPEPVRLTQYTVRRGDSLWTIAAQPEVYADPRRWPVIYQANRRQIRNAHVIYPGQRLIIKRHPASAGMKN